MMVCFLVVREVSTMLQSKTGLLSNASSPQKPGFCIVMIRKPISENTFVITGVSEIYTDMGKEKEKLVLESLGVERLGCHYEGDYMIQVSRLNDITASQQSLQTLLGKELKFERAYGVSPTAAMSTIIYGAIEELSLSKNQFSPS